MSSTPTAIQQELTVNFMQCIENILHENTEGISEYALLTELTKRGFFLESTSSISPSLVLFQKHFLLFHALYLVNDKLNHNKAGSLKIHTLHIKILNNKDATCESGERSDTGVLGKYDPLRDYYLNLKNLKATNEEDVNELLNSFWSAYIRNDKRQDALSTLNLADPVDDNEIKTQYRRLAKKHHPDKGGQTQAIQKINEAYKLLIKS